MTSSRLFLLSLVICVIGQRCIVGRNMWDAIEALHTVRWMAWEMRGKGLQALAEKDNLTLFLPSSEAFFRFNSLQYGITKDDLGRWQKLLMYSAIDGHWKLNDIRKQKKIASHFKFETKSIYLFVNTFNTPEGKITTINGARIIHPDIVTDNGIIHIVDMFIAPEGSPNTIAEYLSYPELPNLDFSAIIFSRSIVKDLSNKTNSTDGLFTSFSPNDSFLYPMPDYGRNPLFNNNALLSKVYLSHVVEDEALFLPDRIRHLTSRISMAGKTELLSFYRWKDSMYVVNNRVHARVIIANIATNNGVIHVIDNLLHYVYHNAVQMAQHHPDTDIWGQLVEKLSTEAKRALSVTRVTVFMPTDGAFSKMPLFYQAELRQESRQDMPLLEKVLFGHFMANADIGSNDLRDGQTITMMNNKSLVVKHIKDEIYLQTLDHRVSSKVEVRDIGITNGVVHLISNVFFADGYTLWEALGDIPMLRRIHDRLVVNFGELRALMSAKEPITVFLPSNAVLERISDYLDHLLDEDSDALLEVLRGHVVSGQIASPDLTETESHTAWSGKIIQTSWSEDTDVISVAGGHVISTVILRDIYCSNGVLHVIDDLLHIPARTIKAELEQRGETMSYFTHLVDTIKDKSYDLDNTGKNYTVFLPMNDAFAYLPWLTVETLLGKANWTQQVLKAHIVEGESRPLEEIPERKALVAEKNLIYLLRSNERVYVVNNNMMAEVVQSNIPAINGWIHVIDRILTIPYVTVAETMASRPDLWAFNKLMQSLPEYLELMKQPDPKVQKVKRKVTLFVPSTRYINTLEPDQLDNIRSNINIIRMLFHGHTVPDVRMDEEFLREHEDKDYKSRTAYNMSFTISKRNGGMFVGVGFDIQPLDLIGRGIGCSDGIIHIIDGFLNYSPFTVWERLQREPSVSQSFEHINKLASSTDRELLNDQHKTFTFLMPDDFALDLFTFNDLLKLHSLPVVEQERIFWRHVINGSTVLYEELKNGYTNTSSLPRDVSINVVKEAVRVRYLDVTSPIKSWNLIACNGVIHVIKRYLYDVNMQNDHAPSTPSTQPPGIGGTPKAGPSAQQAAHLNRASKSFVLTALVTWFLLYRTLIFGPAVVGR